MPLDPDEPDSSIRLLPWVFDGEALRVENLLLRCGGAAVQYAPHAPRAGFRRNTFLCSLLGAAFLHGQDPERTRGPRKRTRQPTLLMDSQ